MAPIKPYAAPPVIPAKPAPAGKAVPPGGQVDGGFKPGLDAPRAAPRLSDLAAPRKPAENAAPAAPAGRRSFTMQALSAYAGMMLDADSGAAGNPGDITPRPAKRPAPDGARPLRPGANVDVKV